MAQSLNNKYDSTFLFRKSSLRFGFGLGYGLTTFRRAAHAYKPLLRPTMELMVQQTTSFKSRLQYKAMYRSFGYRHTPMPLSSSYIQLDFVGLSLTYLHVTTPNEPLFLGIGFSGEYLLKDRIISTLEDGSRVSTASYQTFKSTNWSGQLVGQYQPRITKRLNATVKLEYSFGLWNFLKPIATQTTGRKVYSSGVFITTGIFF